MVVQYVVQLEILDIVKGVCYFLWQVVLFDWLVDDVVIGGVFDWYFGVQLYGQIQICDQFVVIFVYVFGVDVVLVDL